MIMDQEKIQALLRKYYSGATSLEEEQELKAYFTENDVPGSLLPEKEMFTCFSFNNNEDIPSPEFEQKLINSIIGEENNIKKGSKTRILYNVLRVAASLIILSASYIIIDKNTSLFHSHYTYTEIDNPEIAYKEAKKALLMVSSNMNAGLSGLENLEKLNSGKEEILKLKTFNTGIFNLRKITIFEETTKLIINKK